MTGFHGSNIFIGSDIVSRRYQFGLIPDKCTENPAAVTKTC